MASRKLYVEPDEEGGMRLVMYAEAEEGTIFSPRAFDGQIGRLIPVKDGDEPVFLGTVTDVEVVDDGKAAKITLKVQNMAPELAKRFKKRPTMTKEHPGPRSAECGLPSFHEGPCRRLE